MYAKLIFVVLLVLTAPYFYTYHFIAQSDFFPDLELLDPSIEYLLSKNDTFEIETLKTALETTWKQIHSIEWQKLPIFLRDYYSFQTLVLAYFYIQNDSHKSLDWDRSSKRIETLRQIDLALIVGGPTFVDFLHQIVPIFSPTRPDTFPDQWIISEHKCDLVKSVSKGSEVPRVDQPSILEFCRLANRPFIICKALDYWPCISDKSRDWRNVSYLKSLCGHRTVPLEVGKDYLSSDWKQTLLCLSEFIDSYIIPDNPPEIAYLAQTTLFDYIPELKEDIKMLDYVSMTSDDAENSQVFLNAWFGPKGTISPLHTDPYDNLLCQVFGSKYIRLYSPEVSEKLFPHKNEQLKNTSEIGLIEQVDESKYPEFKSLPYLECCLSRGEMLYIPKGWWHYVKSLEKSFSVSFWWT